MTSQTLGGRSITEKLNISCVNSLKEQAPTLLGKYVKCTECQLKSKSYTLLESNDADNIFLYLFSSNNKNHLVVFYFVCLFVRA